MLIAATAHCMCCSLMCSVPFFGMVVVWLTPIVSYKVRYFYCSGGGHFTLKTQLSCRNLDSISLSIGRLSAIRSCLSSNLLSARPASTGRRLTPLQCCGGSPRKKLRKTSSARRRGLSMAAICDCSNSASSGSLLTYSLD